MSDPCAFVSTRVVTPSGLRPAGILVDKGVVQDLVDVDQVPGQWAVKDYGNSVILPGLVDTHVHINEPGRTEWEGFEMATRAAAAGGFTTLVDMPLNCLPETATVEALQLKRAAASGKCTVDWAAWGGVVTGNQRHIIPMAEAGVRGFKCFLIYPGCEGFTMVDEAELRLAAPIVAQTALPLLAHAELAGPIDEAASNLCEADWRSYATYLASRPPEAETEAIAMLIELSREFRCWVHIVHLSAAEALPMLRKAKLEGIRLTVETCPHYLCFAAEEIEDGATQFKCAPPIRSRANREALWEGLRDGTIDLIATDHSPCPTEMKSFESGSFREAWGGIASLGVSLSAVWAEAQVRGFTLSDVARWMSANPAMLANLGSVKGAIAEGHDADFVVFDPEEPFIPTPENLHSRHLISPYVGRPLQGKVRETVLRGKVVHADGAFTDHPAGREVPR